jgi:tetratricopeptide (TPR) repeat protein
VAGRKVLLISLNRLFGFPPLYAPSRVRFGSFVVVGYCGDCFSSLKVRALGTKNMALRGTAGTFLLVTLAVASGAKADEVTEDALPHLQLLTCGSVCMNFTPAKKVKHDFPKYPHGELGRKSVGEGFVWLRYTIGTDGKTHDIAPVYVLGDKAFAQRTIDAVTDWTFEPATVNLRSVPESTFLVMHFNGASIELPHPEVTDASNAAQTLIDGGKDEEARTTLEHALNTSQLNFADRSTLALPLAKLALKQKDYLEARRFVLMGTESGVGYVPLNLAADLWATRVNIDYYLGEYSDAFGTFELLKANPQLDPGPAERQRLDQIRAKTDATPQLITRAMIPNDDEGTVYWHGLYRRSFQFAVASGSLDKFTLSCAQSSMDSKISLTAMWHVPLSWSNCIIYVSGAPGTVFNIIETNDDQEQQDQQLAQLGDAIRADPQNPIPWLARAKSLASFGRWKDAIPDYSKTIELSSKEAVAYLGRSQAYGAIRDYPSALADIDATLLLDPENVQALGLRPAFLLALGKYDEAAAAYDGLKNKNAFVHYVDGISLFCAGRYAEAEDEFKKATSYSGDGRLLVYSWLDVVRRKRGEDDPDLALPPRTDLPYETWIPQIANLYAGRTTIGQVEAVMKANVSDPVKKKDWPCGVHFFLGEYRLVNGDLAGAKADLSAISPMNCMDAEASAAVAELKRLPAN